MRLQTAIMVGDRHYSLPPQLEMIVKTQTGIKTTLKFEANEYVKHWILGIVAEFEELSVAEHRHLVVLETCEH